MYATTTTLGPSTGIPWNAEPTATSARSEIGSPHVKRNFICKYGLVWQSKVQTGLYQTWGRSHNG